MTRALKILEAGPALSVQDMGRPGFQRFGVSQGGAMDCFALAEGAALLGNDDGAAVIEMAGLGGRFIAEGGPLRCALTGAVMRADIDGETLAWRSSFILPPGETLTVGPVSKGLYGYLHVGGGIVTAPEVGARATHLRAGIGGLDGRLLQAGDSLPVGADEKKEAGLGLPEPDYFSRRRFRILWGAQAHHFSEGDRARLTQTAFKISTRRDRMGIRLEPLGDPFISESSLVGISDAVVLGDLQVPGDGFPVALMADRQPTGGYPRIATVISADIPALAQVPSGQEIGFDLVEMDTAVAALKGWRDNMKALKSQRQALLRDPRAMNDLLRYNLIGGAITGTEGDGKEEDS